MYFIEPVFWDVIIVIRFRSLKQIDVKWLFLLYRGYVYIDVFPLMICVPLHIDCCYSMHRCNSDY
jgi:phosphoribulokinase